MFEFKQGDQVRWRGRPETVRWRGMLETIGSVDSVDEAGTVFVTLEEDFYAAVMRDGVQWGPTSVTMGFSPYVLEKVPEGVTGAQLWSESGEYKASFSRQYVGRLVRLVDGFRTDVPHMIAKVDFQDYRLISTETGLAYSHENLIEDDTFVFRFIDDDDDDEEEEK